MPYFEKPVRRVKIQTKSKNSQGYYTTKRLMRDYYPTHVIFMAARENLVDIFSYEECVTEVYEAERNWR